MKARFCCAAGFPACLLWAGVACAQQAAPSAPPASEPPVVLPEVVVESTRASALQGRAQDMDQSRDDFLLPKLGATAYSMDRQAIDALPQGNSTPLDKVLLQAPGVSYDSAVSNPDFHVRNEYANVQYRLNGILLPEGVSGLGPILEVGFIGNLNLLVGALPAQYGLRTAGVVDITTRDGYEPGGTASVEGGSLATFSPAFDYGSTKGDSQYFVTGRYFQSNEGLENPMPAASPVHDQTTQGKFFGYGTTFLGDARRLTYMAGASYGRFQIPNTGGQSPLGDFVGPAPDSSSLNENEYDSFVFGLVALQSKGDNYDTQFSVFTRYTAAHFVPDINGDLAFNDVASNVSRRSWLTGTQFDGAYRVSDIHTLRAGFGITAERTRVDDNATLLPLDANGDPLPVPINVDDRNSRLGWNLGAYVQDEWKISRTVTLNTGLRFDYLDQFVVANQFSPRVAVIYKPVESTTIHAGYARYFTPPMQAQATPANLALFNNTAQQPVIAGDDPARPERSHYFDVGVDQKFLPGLTAGLDVYFKRATDQLDDGQFGQAIVLTQFNYAQGYSEGAEFKVNYENGGFRTYANFSVSRTKVKTVNSNQFLFTDPVEFAYLQTNYHYTDDSQIGSGSAGASYRFDRTLLSLNGIYGSGLRSGFANLDHVAPYVQLNLAIARAFNLLANDKPFTARLSVVNLLDKTYLLRSGDGIGEFAPQYGPRRGVFLTLSHPI
jgi:outer membrane receptor protein involved in Fe transport